MHLAATEVACVAGVTAYHTSIHVDGREYYFDIGGILTGPSLRSHTGGRMPGPKTKVIDLGNSPYDGEQMHNILAPLFPKGSYDVLRKNCNSFTDAAIYLLLGSRAPGLFSRGERLLLATEPLSMSIVPAIMALRTVVLGERGSATDAVQRYDCNPYARGFSVDGIINSHLKDLREGLVSATTQRSGHQGQKSTTKKKQKERRSWAFC